jgi:hypothetical protein
MFSRGSLDNAAVPHIVDSDTFQCAFGKSFLDFLLKFEQWSCMQNTGVFITKHLIAHP